MLGFNDSVAHLKTSCCHLAVMVSHDILCVAILFTGQMPFL